LSETDLLALLVRLKASAQFAKLQNSVGQLADTSMIRRLRKNIAEIKTILSQKQIQAKKGLVNA
jgi:ribosomal protein L29